MKAVHTRRSKPTPSFRSLGAHASALALLLLVGCASAPTNDASTPVLTIEAPFAQAWDASIEVLGTERLVRRCVRGVDDASVSEVDCPDLASDRRQGPIGLLGTEWAAVDPSGLRCGAAEVFSGHQGQFEVTIWERSGLNTTVRVNGTYRARAASGGAGAWSACASNGELEREIRFGIVQEVEARLR